MPSLLQIIILAIVQGLAELLPVSSSAHVVVAEKLMRLDPSMPVLDPSSPAMTLLLVMLHTGTMFAVIAYFWKQWKFTYFKDALSFKRFAIRAAWATILTGLIGYPISKIIEKTVFRDAPKAQIEDLFSHLEWIAPALLAAGILIVIAGLMERRRMGDFKSVSGDGVTMRQAGWIGFIQGLCLPFRGFSRSGATISTGMLAGSSKERAERFSFALAVILTPPVVLRETLRLVKAVHGSPTGAAEIHAAFLTSLLGMVFAFLAGLVALKWLSSWLESGRWYLFGIYCIAASGFVFYLHTAGY
ncbi:undecaprenyl-diphosphate phosphatase [Granulicella arctica]|uniref:undecaprenyl-diphosphate phosphatase n=1 Tax=Granulicella arctica TaxID=940613 RepID=UPI0021E049E6|nr:undecaprenyl-diphosphate phosphatase [Granulicella arctica]